MQTADGYEPVASLGIALASGLLIGLEREQSVAKSTDPSPVGSFLGGARTYPLVTSGNNQDVFLTIAYHEDFDAADHSTEGGADDFRRTTERPVLQDTATAPPADGSVILLARIRLNAESKIDSDAAIDAAVRTVVSAKIGPKAIANAQLADGAVTLEKLATAVQPLAVRESRAARLALRTLAPFGVLMPALALLVWWIVGRALEPFRTLTRLVAARRPGSLDPLSTGGLPVEIRPLVDALNELLARLEESLGHERAFIADAAHELRTPLTALDLNMILHVVGDRQSDGSLDARMIQIKGDAVGGKFQITGSMGGLKGTCTTSLSFGVNGYDIVTDSATVFVPAPLAVTSRSTQTGSSFALPNQRNRGSTAAVAPCLVNPAAIQVFPSWEWRVVQT